MISITPFGQTGPYAGYKAHDIVAWARGGFLYRYGDSDRVPIRISHHPQGWLHAGATATVAAMIALHQRHKDGYGQYIGISIQEFIAYLQEYPLTWWDNVALCRPGIPGDLFCLIFKAMGVRDRSAQIP